jgi:hypothetical protein
VSLTYLFAEAAEHRSVGDAIVDVAGIAFLAFFLWLMFRD